VLTVLTADRLFTPLESIEQPVVVIEAGRIVLIGTRDAITLPQGARHLDYRGYVIAPASLDIHTHGAGGHDVMEGTAAALAAVGLHHAKHGVAAYLPTTVTAPLDTTLRGLEGIAAAIEAGSERDAKIEIAQPLGIHLEGPFLSHAKRGVHSPDEILPPDIKLFDRFWQAARGHIRLMTIAPELPGALDLIAHARALGVRISLGHSNATAAEALAGITAGASTATHTFNAMRAFDHRESGLLGVVLDRDDLFAEIIADGVHVSPAAVRLFYHSKPYGRAILVTDSMSATGMPDGTYRLGDLEVQVANGVCTYQGKLAGSVLTMDRAIENFTAYTQCGVALASRMASYNPALMLGLEDRVGMLAEGRPASFNLLADDGSLHTTMLRGALVE
jgi:N-acetylglucosamine-6-phosphate deacetylase